MDPVILAILLVVVLFAALLWNKIPTPITMMVIPFVFALIVDAITNRTLDRIDMIGALKSVE